MFMVTLPVALRAGTRRPTVPDLADFQFRRKLAEIHGKYGPWRVFQDFVTMSFCALSMGRREEQYLEVVNRYKKPDVYTMAEAFRILIDEMEDHPYTDLLGQVYMDIKSQSDKQRSGQFLTPQAIAKVIAEMTLDVDSTKGRIASGQLIRVLEPAVGGGQMILSMWQVLKERGLNPMQFQVTAIDVDRVLCEISYINFTLWGIPAHIIQGDTLRMQCLSVEQKTIQKQESVTGQLDLFQTPQIIEETVTRPVISCEDDEFVWNHFYTPFWQGGVI